MQLFGLVGLLVIVAVAAWLFTSMEPVTPTQYTEGVVEQSLDPVLQADIAAHADRIVLTSPRPGEAIGSPLTLTGRARGYWYFEGSFPVILTDWDGRIIAEVPAMASGPWMTEDFVPFTVTFPFEEPYQEGEPDFRRRGSIILKKDNPSGILTNDDALEIPIYYRASREGVPAVTGQPLYDEVIDPVNKAATQLEL